VHSKLNQSNRKPAKNRIWFGCIHITFLLNRLVQFAVFILPMELNRNIRKLPIEPMSRKPILIKTFKN